MAGGENFHDYNDTYYDGADGMYDDGPFTPDWSTLTQEAEPAPSSPKSPEPEPKTPEPTAESTPNSHPATNFVNDRDAMYANWRAQQYALDEDEEYQKEKNKWVNRGYINMVHWYKEHPEEIGDLMYEGVEHDENWYREQQLKDPRTIGRLAADYLRTEREHIAKIQAEQPSLTAEQAKAKAKSEIHEEYLSSIRAEDNTKAKVSTGDGAPVTKIKIEDGYDPIDDMEDAYLEHYKEQHEGSQNKTDVQNSARGELEDAERARLEAAERAELEEAELARLKERQKEIQAQKTAIDRELRQISQPQSRGENVTNGETIPDDNPEAIDNKIEKDDIKRLKDLEQELDELIKGGRGQDGEKWPGLAELYARNRRLFVGANNRKNFVKARERYEARLDEYLKLKTEMSYSSSRRKADAKINDLAVRLIADLKSGKINLDQAEEVLAATNDEQNKKVASEVNAKFLSDYLKQRRALEDATIDALDNGTTCRKLVSKIFGNTKFKVALGVAGAAGLAATGVGLATGALVASIGYTAGGVAIGAGKGLLSGAAFSRQDSKNSAVRGFASNKKAVNARLSQIEISRDKDGKVNVDTANVAGWLMDQYKKANELDAKSNKKRTAIAAGLSAALGAAASGVHINRSVTSTIQKQELAGYTPDAYETKINDVNIPEGAGMKETFSQLGGDSSKFQEAFDVATSIDSKYGLVPGSNGEIPGFNGQVGNYAHTYPGRIDSWPEVARSYITEVIGEWAKRGLIPVTKIPGQPIFNTVTNTITDYVPSFMREIFAGSAVIGVGGATSGAIASADNRER